MKVITFAGGLNNNAFTPSTVIDEKQQRIDGYLIHDWDGAPTATITMQWVLDDSLNNGAIDAGKMEGENDFYNNLLAFGIGAPTGVDLAGEVNDPLPAQSTWNALKYAEAVLRPGRRDHAGGDAGRHQRGRQRRRLGAAARRQRDHQPEHRQTTTVSFR